MTEKVFVPLLYNEKKQTPLDETCYNPLLGMRPKHFIHLIFLLKEKQNESFTPSESKIAVQPQASRNASWRHL